MIRGPDSCWYRASLALDAHFAYDFPLHFFKFFRGYCVFVYYLF